MTRILTTLGIAEASRRGKDLIDTLPKTEQESHYAEGISQKSRSLVENGPRSKVVQVGRDRIIKDVVERKESHTCGTYFACIA